MEREVSLEASKKKNELVRYYFAGSVRCAGAARLTGGDQMCWGSLERWLSEILIAPMGAISTCSVSVCNEM